MVDHGITTQQHPAAIPESGRLADQPEKRSIAIAGEGLPIAPNVAATVVSFFVLVVVPPVGWQVIFAIFETEEVSGVLLPTGFLQIVASALGGSLLFLVIGLILQLWELHKPFASWRPVALAFPVAWVLLVPNALAGNGSVRFWFIVGAVIALAFSLHWLALLGARDAMD
jgi:hypothetical protein